MATFIQRKAHSLALRILFKLSPLMGDKTYLRLRFLLDMHQWLSFKHPRTFNQKLQWLKVYDRKPLYTTMVDKYAVKDYIGGIIGKQYIIPTLGVWNHFDDINFNDLPKQFVLKTTHYGGGNGIVICRDKDKLDKQETRMKLERTLTMDIYKNYREWPYKNVPHRIIAEELITPPSSDDKSDTQPLNDYKFFCFNGKVRMFKIDYGRFTEHHANYYDTDGRLLPFGEAALPPQDKPGLVPNNFRNMIQLAEKIAKGITFLRVDFYDVDGKIYFGEATFYPASGMGRFTDDKWDYKLGEMLTLPDNYNIV